ncbi:MAG: AAA family ATPase [bacterium]|nr:AAA family ATPase [bacterium]
MFRRHLNISKKRSFFLFGARATGKTTLLQSLFKENEVTVIDLLDAEILAKLQAYPQEFLPMVQTAIKARKTIIVDEIQKVPALLDYVHQLIQKEKAVFGLTGSSARKLKRGSANMLAGRASVYKLYPLLYSEIGESFNIETALNWGTLPEVWTLDETGERSRLLQAYAETYVQEEVVAEQLVRNLPPFRRFLQVAAQMNSKVINASKIAADISTDPSNVKNYFEILEDTLLGFRLDAYHGSIRKRQRQSPKFYWFDTGVVRAIQRHLDMPVTSSTSYYGELFESFIINQIKTILEYSGKQFRLSFLLTKDGAEIDLIVERAGSKTLCIEIKSGTVVRREDFTNLRKLAADIPNSLSLCVYNGSQRLQYDQVKVLPWQEALQSIEPSK